VAEISGGVEGRHGGEDLGWRGMAAAANEVWCAGAAGRG
jgi:hypothetical protein